MPDSWATPFWPAGTMMAMYAMSQAAVPGRAIDKAHYCSEGLVETLRQMPEGGACSCRGPQDEIRRTAFNYYARPMDGAGHCTPKAQGRQVSDGDVLNCDLVADGKRLSRRLA
jgi:hypothetical protein